MRTPAPAPTKRGINCRWNTLREEPPVAVRIAATETFVLRYLSCAPEQYRTFVARGAQQQLGVLSEKWVWEREEEECALVLKKTKEKNPRGDEETGKWNFFLESSGGNLRQQQCTLATLFFPFFKVDSSGILKPLGTPKLASVATAHFSSRPILAKLRR